MNEATQLISTLGFPIALVLIGILGINRYLPKILELWRKQIEAQTQTVVLLGRVEKVLFRVLAYFDASKKSDKTTDKTE